MASFSLLSLASMLSNNQFVAATQVQVEDDGGYPVERFVANMEEYLCAICREVCRYPVSINCGHTFCKKCLEKSETNFKNQCPQCRVVITQVVPSFNMKMKIDGSQIRCKYSEFDCNVIDAVSRIMEHEFICEKKHIDCEQCDTMQLFSEIENHKKNICESRPTSCHECLKTYPFNKAQDHDAVCLMKTVECIDCNESFKRMILPSHIDNECKKYIIPCIYHNYGCEYECKREDMSDHIDKTNHIPIICATLDKKMDEWDTLIDSQLQSGPFRVSGHGHVVLLCSDLENTLCRGCKKIILPRNGRFFGYACNVGCAFNLCLSCFPKQRLYRSKRSNVPQQL